MATTEARTGVSKVKGRLYFVGDESGRLYVGSVKTKANGGGDRRKEKQTDVKRDSKRLYFVDGAGNIVSAARKNA